MSHPSKRNNLVGVEAYVVYCPLIGKTRKATDCFIPGGDSCEHFGGLDRDSWRDEDGEAMVAMRCNYEAEKPVML